MLVALAAIIAVALAYLMVDQFWLSKRVDTQKALVEATPTSPANLLWRSRFRISRSRSCPSWT